MAGPLDTLVQPGVRSDYVASGPIAGVMAAQQLQDWMDAQGRSSRDSDLAYQSNLNKYNNDLLDNPVKMAQRQLDMSAKADEQQAWDNGTNAQAMDAKRQQQIQEAIAGKNSAELKQAQAKANQFLASTNEMEDPKVPGAIARNKELWDNKIYPFLSANGMAKGIPKEYDPNVTHQIIAQRSQAAIQTSEMIQKSLLVGQEGQIKKNVANIEGDWRYKAARDAGVRQAEIASSKEDAFTQAEKNIIAKAQTEHAISTDEYNQLIEVTKVKYRQANPLDKALPAYRNEYQEQMGNPTNKAQLAASVGLTSKATPNDYAMAKYNEESTKFAKSVIDPMLQGATVGGGTASKPNIKPITPSGRSAGGLIRDGSTPATPTPTKPMTTDGGSRIVQSLPPTAVKQPDGSWLDPTTGKTYKSVK